MIKNDDGVIIGAQPQSLGAALQQALPYTAAGITTEPVRWDARHSYAALANALGYHPRVIINTVGINEPTVPGWVGPTTMIMNMNYEQHQRLVSEWWAATRNERPWGTMPGVYVCISSNSAHIARSASSAYCASKAALSMGMRSTARWFASNDEPYYVLIVEPGWMAGTPMSEAVMEHLPAGVAPHRIPGMHSEEGISQYVIAEQVRLMVNNPRSYNGCPIRIDGGEQ
jgi:NAD(P)-dependent dehydrogenase (short-subunit alcohol dehydrogenase family)